MEVEFNNQIKQIIRKESISEFPKEICGFIYFDKINYKFDIFKCKNIAYSKNKNFTISPYEYLECSKLGKIVACYHSHSNNNKEFSEMDKENSNIYNINYILYNVKYDTFNFYIPNTEKNNYVGKPFILGKSDCFTLMQEYAQKEENIILKFPSNILYPRDLKSINDLYEKNFLEAGFIKMEKDVDLKKSDGIMMLFPAISNQYPTHAAVYIGNNLILHQPYNCFSCVNLYDNFFKKHTSYVLRHRSKL